MRFAKWALGALSLCVVQPAAAVVTVSGNFTPQANVEQITSLPLTVFKPGTFWKVAVALDKPVDTFILTGIVQMQDKYFDFGSVTPSGIDIYNIPYVAGSVDHPENATILFGAWSSSKQFLGPRISEFTYAVTSLSFLTRVVNPTGPINYTATFTQSALPEPTTWAMMIVGFGAVGASMRKRRSGAARLSFAEAMSRR